MAVLMFMDLALGRWIFWLLGTLGTQSDAQMYMKVDNHTHEIKKNNLKGRERMD